MWAANVGARSFSWDKHEKEMSGEEGREFDVVYDGMSGQYCYAGKILASTDGYDGTDPVMINPDNIGTDKAELMAKIKESFGRPDLVDADFSLIMFSHWS
jgi:hypothetical protein